MPRNSSFFGARTQTNHMLSFYGMHDSNSFFHVPISIRFAFKWKSQCEKLHWSFILFKVLNHKLTCETHIFARMERLENTLEPSYTFSCINDKIMSKGDVNGLWKAFTMDLLQHYISNFIIHPVSLQYINSFYSIFSAIALTANYVFADEFSVTECSHLHCISFPIWFVE